MLSRVVIVFLPRNKCLLISWLQSPSVVILEPKKIKSVTVSIVSPSICHEVMGPDAMIFVFWMLSFKPAFHSPLTFIKRLLSSSSLSAIRVVSSPYSDFSRQSWFQLMLHPTQHFTWCTLHISWISRVTNPVCCSMSVSNCCFLTCIQVSQEAGKVVWYSHLLKNFPQFVVIYTVKGFDTVNKAEIDVFLELPCFFHDPTVVGNLISGSSAFSKISLNIWKFMVHVLLKPGLENF